MTGFATNPLTITAAALLANTPALAKGNINLANYPQLAPDGLLLPILAELRHTLPDVSSIRDMRIYVARRVRLKDGKPSDGGVEMQFNTRNQAVSYTRARCYISIFGNDRIF